MVAEVILLLTLDNRNAISGTALKFWQVCKVIVSSNKKNVFQVHFSDDYLHLSLIILLTPRNLNAWISCKKEKISFYKDKTNYVKKQERKDNDGIVNVK